jgi:hypothetical protein
MKRTKEKKEKMGASGEAAESKKARVQAAGYKEHAGNLRFMSWERAQRI